LFLALQSYAKMPEKRMRNESPTGSEPEITLLLTAWREGDSTALERLVPVVYRELRRIAGNFMRRQDRGHTLQATALINEAYLRLVDSDKVNWQSRTHFFAVSAQLMRRVLVDSARQKNSQKRGGDHLRITLDDRIDIPLGDQTDLVSLDEALSRLNKLSSRQSQVVELRYFGGLTESQIAETLKVSERTVRRDWNLARTWLYRELQQRP
jgi:RNA polymerase sigma-70 factor (ECF subfamily)